jgi:hypothetical protein
MTVRELRNMLNNVNGDIPVFYYASKENEWRSGDELKFTLDHDDSKLNKEGLGTLTLFIDD